jgi:ribosomal protein S18 acetylase RimI-like enzyme
MLDDYARRIAAGQAWILEEHGKPVGVPVLEEAGDDALRLDNVAVASAAQRRGHGQALIAFAAAEARRRGCRELRLYTHVLVQENRALYARLSFQETGRATEKGYKRVYMARALD